MNTINNIPLDYFIILSAILFCIGISGIFINRKNIISLLMSIELMLLAVNFVAFSASLNDLVGQIYAIFVLTVAGAEAAIGLAILIIYFQNRRTIETSDISTMKG